MKLFYPAMRLFMKACCLAIMLLSYTGVHATVYNVTNTTDGNGLNQFRGALLAAAATVGPHSVNVAAGTYNLTLGQIAIGNLNSQNISIIGAGAGTTIINMTSFAADRILNIGNGSFTGVQISIQGLSFSGGRLTSDFYGGGAIIAGGPNCVLTLTNCTFSNNYVDISAGGGSGGAVSMQGGGALNISGCTFNNNSTTAGDGGAIDYFLQNFAGLAGSMNITGNIFSNNSALGATTSGGVFNIAAQGENGGTFSVNISKNIFFNNHADASSGSGGAMFVINSFSPTNTVNANLNKFNGNTANISATSAVSMAQTDGNLNVTNNWWACNEGPTGTTGCEKAALTAIGGTGVLTTAPYLKLTATGVPTSVCALGLNTTSAITATVLKNSAGTTLTTTDVSLLIGLPIGFSGNGIATVSGAQTTIQANGNATANLTANGSGIGAAPIATVENAVTPGVVPVLATLPITAAATSVTQATGFNSNIYQTACTYIGTVVPSGVLPVSGNVTAKVWLETAVRYVGSQPYVARHYEIVPVTNPSTATARVTLYFTQAEFDAFNAATGSTLNLPANASDVAGKSNLKLTRYNGVSSNGTGLPGSYNTGAMVIDPLDSDIVYNTGLLRWEVSFNTVGFGGYVVQTQTTVLPVKIVSFTAKLNTENTASLAWAVAEQLNISSYLIEKSTDGSNYTEIGNVSANTATNSNYSFSDLLAGSGYIYYRLKIVDKDGSSTYSNIVILNSKAKQSVSIFPNPVSDAITLKSTGAPLYGTAQLVDANGRAVKSFMMYGNIQTVNVEDLPKGLYLLKLQDGSVFKIIKQ